MLVSQAVKLAIEMEIDRRNVVITYSGPAGPADEDERLGDFQCTCTGSAAGTILGWPGN